MKKPKLAIIRKVRFWVRYQPRGKFLIACHRTKAKAVAKQLAGEVVFDVVGFYAPGTIKRAKRRSS